MTKDEAAILIVRLPQTDYFVVPNQVAYDCILPNPIIENFYFTSIVLFYSLAWSGQGLLFVRP